MRVEILSKSKLERCEQRSLNPGELNCSAKIALNLAVPSGSSGGEASIVAEIVEVEENSTNNMQTLRIPPIVTVSNSAAYAVYDLTYIRDVPFKPQEFSVKTRKCEPDASGDIVKICERLKDESGHIIEATQPVCCPCGPQRRVPSSCGNIFDKLVKGKANTAHCLRFPGDWFHVFGIGQRSLGFNIRVEVKTGSKVLELTVGLENRTATSNDNFLRVNLIGDFAGYKNMPSFEDFYLVTARLGGAGQPQDLGKNYSMWMLLERVRFMLDDLECNKIGVTYEAFNGQPNFCSSPFWSCLHNQLWNFWEADQNRVSRSQVPLYGVQGRFERINEHPNAGSHSFSIGVTEVLNTNLLMELRADDIEFVYQSPGKILSVTVPQFEALTQFGVASVTTKNTGEVEASYSLTFDCSRGVSLMEEKYFIMKPKETTTRSFKLYPTSDQAAKYLCSSILKDSSFNEVDRAECQFTTTATVLDNGSQVTSPEPPKTGISGFFDSIETIWHNLWTGLIDFITGRTCRTKCSSFFDFSCHIQYICMSWVVMFGLLLAIILTALVLLWLLHQKGLLDPLYDWWEDHFATDFKGKRHHHDHIHTNHHFHGEKHYNNRYHHHHQHEATLHRRNRAENDHLKQRDADYNYYLHHVHEEKRKHKNSVVMKHVDLDKGVNESVGHARLRKERKIVIKGSTKKIKH
ncbi:LOW QUALITY PROTEIN: protein HAPLESS 2-like [Rutidosis leptorrhynchoides]|uniref:LOW QUALITY PROTEIN: protein HAPLESS 2-like n=1 Tax=Rutidosis leptorrhynchoides TaxID=125765 RepID=UPI003A995DAA